MKITVKGTPKEIAALMVESQGRQDYRELRDGVIWLARVIHAGHTTEMPAWLKSALKE